MSYLMSHASRASDASSGGMLHSQGSGGVDVHTWELAFADLVIEEPIGEGRQAWVET